MKHGRTLTTVLAAGLLAPLYVETCSPPPKELRFTPYHNMLPSEVADGRLGVLRPHFRRRYLLLAYRELSGIPIKPAELDPPVDREGRQGPEPWLAARALVPGLAASAPIDPEKKVPGQDFEFYENCLSNAFASAAATLQNRVSQWGPRSPLTLEWVRGQDQVFQNCSAGPAIPARVPATDKLLSADREYQIAAAEFYAGRFDQAKSDFDRIAADSASPWHDTAHYVAARVCVRQGTLGKDKDKLGEAATRLAAIAKDPAAASWRASAEALLGFVRAQADPLQRLNLLGEQLLRPQSPEQLERVLTDYTNIWDHLPAETSYPPESDVAHWIAVFQSKEPAIEIWRARKTVPWLIAALEKSQPHDPAAQELIAAAHAVPANSPGYDSVTYYGILTQIRAGEVDAARAWPDAAMAGKLAPSTMNLLRSERLRMARDWTEFLRYAPRRPVAQSSEDDELDGPVAESMAKEKPYALDADSVNAMNLTVPLSLWVDAARNSLLPSDLQADLAQAGWVRAVILNDAASAKALAERLRQLKPELAAEMRTWLAEKDAPSSHFAAIFLMLRAPGLEPLLRMGRGRETSVMMSDVLRDNWWMLVRPVDDNSPVHEALFDLYPDGHFGPSEFLPDSQRSSGVKEWRQLTQQADNSVNYLCAQTIDWAQAHPQDARVPQALHLAVEATHYGQSNNSTVFSKQAFELLHRRYPASEWTKKTKYWY